MEFRNHATARDVLQFTQSVLDGELNLNANLANLAALLNQYLPRINWVGFYLWEEHSHEWVLGPFAGQPACTRIGFDRGIVGRALSLSQMLVVPNVLEFEGHIACDDASRSEVVIPVISENRVVGGLDVDSPEYGRFSESDVALLASVCQLLGQRWSSCHWY